jgi:hypothetical protein
VPEEPSSTESSRVLGGSGDGANDDVLSPRSIRFAAPSVATLEAEISGHSTATGKPVFEEPDFAPGPVVDDVEPVEPEFLRRSPGSFSASTARHSDTVSPTER